MAVIVHSYDVKKVMVLLGGAIVNGFAKDSAIKIEFNSDTWTLSKGADGEAARSKSNDQSAKITLTLMPGSVANTILAQAAAADRATGLGVLPIEITDLTTGTTHTSLGAWVMKSPAVNYQQQVSPKEWILECADLTELHGFAP